MGGLFMQRVSISGLGLKFCFTISFLPDQTHFKLPISTKSNTLLISYGVFVKRLVCIHNE